MVLSALKKKFLKDKKEIKLDSVKLNEISSSQKTPQEILNSRLVEHSEFNKKIIDEINSINEKQISTIERYGLKSSRYKSVSLIKKISIELKKWYDYRIKKDPELEKELLSLKRQVDSTLVELDKGPKDMSVLIKFLKIPYKDHYKNDEIENYFKVIENKNNSKKEMKSAALKYKNKLTALIKEHHNAKNIADEKYNTFTINEKFNPASILESNEFQRIMTYNEEMIFLSFKNLKSNIEMLLFLNENAKDYYVSKTFIEFAHELKKELDKTYSNIGKKHEQEIINRMIDEEKEEEKIDNAQEKIESVKEIIKEVIEENSKPAKNKEHEEKEDKKRSENKNIEIERKSQNSEKNKELSKSDDLSNDDIEKNIEIITPDKHKK